MAEKEMDKELLELGVEELRRAYDHISRSFEQLRTKALALIAGEVAIVSFIFSSNQPRNGILGHSVPIYGIVMFGIGIALLVIAGLIFLYVSSTSHWSHPPDEKDMVNLHKNFNNRTEFLEQLRLEYITAIPECIKKISPRARRFMVGVYMLVIGIFILLLIKYCGGTV